MKQGLFGLFSPWCNDKNARENASHCAVLCTDLIGVENFNNSIKCAIIRRMSVGFEDWEVYRSHCSFHRSLGASAGCNV